MITGTDCLVVEQLADRAAVDQGQAVQFGQSAIGQLTSHRVGEQNRQQITDGRDRSGPRR